MSQIQPVLACRNEADLGAWAAPDPPVDPVRVSKRLRREALLVDDACFLIDPVVAKPDVQAAFRHCKFGLDK